MAMSFSSDLQAMSTAFPHSLPSDLARFLKSRRGDLTEATKMYRNFEEWKKSTLPIDLTSTTNEILHNRVFYELPGYAVDGSSVLVFHGPNHSPSKYSTEDTMKSILSVTLGVLSQRSIDHPGDPRITILVFAPKGTPFDIKGISALATTFSKYFPETLSKAIVFPTGPLTPFLWRTASVFLDPATAEKVVLLQGRDPHLTTYVPVKNTPSRFLPEELQHAVQSEPLLLPNLDVQQDGLQNGETQLGPLLSKPTLTLNGSPRPNVAVPCAVPSLSENPAQDNMANATQTPNQWHWWVAIWCGVLLLLSYCGGNLRSSLLSKKEL
jgi:hypothetical protein